MLDHFADRIKRIATSHRQGSEPNFFIFATPRSGSTWLAELLATQGRCKIVNEPLNLRKAVVRDNLKLYEWSDLFQPHNRPMIRSYIQSFIDGTDTDVRFHREKPFTQFWHLRTDRIVFKMLFGGEDDIHWYRREFGGCIVHLLRHPIAVAQSREQLPRMDSYLARPYSDNFSSEQIRHAREIIGIRDAFLMRIVDWCLQNAVLLRQASEATVVLAYEQLVLQPEQVIAHLAGKLSLPDPERMLQRVYRASRSTSKSSFNSQNVLRDDAEIRRQRTWLVDKWRERVSADQERLAFEILAAFDIDFYSAGQSLPTRPLSQVREN